MSKKTTILQNTNFILSTEKYEDILFLYENFYLKGESLRSIARIFGISKPTITNIFKKFNLKIFSCLESKKVFKDKISKRRKDTNILKYGVEHVLQDTTIKEKYKQTCRDKFGCDNPSQNKDIVEKRKITITEKYGVTNYSKTEGFKEKFKQTCRNNFGCDNPSQSKEVKEKVRIKQLEKGGQYQVRVCEQSNVTFLGKYDGLTLRDNKHKHLFWIEYTFRCNICNKEFVHNFAGGRIYCPICFPSFRSVPEIRIADYVENFGFIVETNKRDIIKPYEIDIFIPNKNIAFEYNGLYSHKDKHKYYHRDKTDLSLKMGIKLYHIWEQYPQDKIDSKIKQTLGLTTNKLYARNLDFRVLSAEEKKIFFDTNHLDKDTNSIFAVGLLLENKIYEAASFRKHKEGLEIARLATVLDYHIVGGFSKILKHSIDYIKEKHPLVNKIITYCNRDWTPDYTDSGYFKSGFNFVKDSGPILFYFNSDTKKVYSRENFQKYKIVNLPGYSESKTANEILKENHIYPLYNSGNWKFELEI